MAIFETFSKRQKKLLNQGAPDPYRYDIFPQALRVQVINPLSQILGNCSARTDVFGDVHRNEEAAARWPVVRAIGMDLQDKKVCTTSIHSSSSG